MQSYSPFQSEFLKLFAMGSKKIESQQTLVKQTASSFTVKTGQV